MANTVRYWDGTAWTEQVAPASGGASQGVADAASDPPPAESQEAKPGGTGCLKYIGIFAALVVVLAIINAFTGSEEDRHGDKYEAQVACEDFVESRLKAPSTAEFSHSSHTHMGDGVWRVRGSVDSQNSFGAMVRNMFMCEVKYQGDDRWSLASLDTE